ncbi:MAG: hypothetical protein JEZ14_18145 [Marinilabiliaceae bacterium]|nr:hypothetical protein [Marinilabiliaceae bacterium]
MFKKVSHILLAILLLLTTMGMTVSKHYCGNNLKSVSLFSEPQSCCDIPTGCCHDESLSIAFQAYYSVSSFHYNFEQLAVLMPIVLQVMNEGMLESNPATVFYETPPPPPLIQTVLSNLQTYLL